MSMKYKKGDVLKCVVSKSNAYKVGKLYEVKENENRIQYLTGDDGLDDFISMLVSGFKKLEETSTEKAIRKWKT